MKFGLAVVLVLVASTSFGEDGNVSRNTLSALGLSELEVMSDGAGLAVRGRSSSASASGSSLVFGQLLVPSSPGNFFVASDVNGSGGSAENAGLQILTTATQGPQGSSIAGLLNIQAGNPATQIFLGSFAGNAGWAANVGAAGISSAAGQ